MSTFAPHRADTLRIHVYAVCWNEEQFLPFFLRYYHYPGLLRCILRHRRVRDGLPASAFQTKTGYQFRWGPAKIAGRFANYRVNANDVNDNRRSLLSLSIGPVLNLTKDFYWKLKKRL